MQLGRFGSAVLSLFIICFSVPAQETGSRAEPVKVVADQLLGITMPKGTGQLPLYVSLAGHPVDLTRPNPAVTRALIVFHGKQRNADTYNESGLTAIKHAGAEGKETLLITPQFLAQVDVDAFHLPATMLRWAPEAWMGGNDALNSHLSSFDAIDAILIQLANRELFPNLKTVVLAGHSGGGQVVQRYAVVGKAGARLIAAGVHLRYVVANPSSYVYFSPERPVLRAKDEFTFALPVKSCYGRYNNWKYGINMPPPYVGDASFAELEQRYMRKDVRYLLGTDDVDPNHPALDKTCSAEDEGPYRFFRGKAYFKYLEQRHPELGQDSASQQLFYVPGVGHDGDRMLNSTCGLAALFDQGSCTTRTVNPMP